MIRVTHVITGLSADGAERMLQRVVQRMDQTVFRNEIISLTDCGVIGEEMSAAGIPVTAVHMGKSVGGMFGLYRLRKALKRSKPDVVQTWMYHADLLGGIAAKANSLRTPVVWGIHHGSLDRETNKRSTVLTARLCAALSRSMPARVVCCSKASQAAHIRFGYAAEKMAFIPNGFDTDKFRPDETKRQAFRRELGASSGISLIGMAARFHRHKDHAGFISAAATLARKNDSVQFALCGSGVDWGNKELVSSVREAGLQEKIHLLGQQENMPGFFAGIDVATSSSRTEAFPLAIGEAMSAGVPCVVTDVGDSAYLVGNTGIVVDAGSPDALAGAWNALLSTGREQLAHMGAAARNRIEAEFSLSMTTKQYEHTYVALTQKSRRDGGVLNAREVALDCPSPERS